MCSVPHGEGNLAIGAILRVHSASGVVNPLSDDLHAITSSRLNRCGLAWIGFGLACLLFCAVAGNTCNLPSETKRQVMLRASQLLIAETRFSHPRHKMWIANHCCNWPAWRVPLLYSGHRQTDHLIQLTLPRAGFRSAWTPRTCTMASAETTAKGAFERIRAAHGPGLPRVTVEWRDFSVVGSEAAPRCCKTNPVQIVQGVTAKALPGRLTLVRTPMVGLPRASFERVYPHRPGKTLRIFARQDPSPGVLPKA